MFKKLLMGAVLATSFASLGCGPTEDKPQNPEAIPNIPPSDRGGAMPGATGAPAQKSGKVARPN